MPVNNKLTLSIFPAALVTTLLFYLMYFLIHSDQVNLDERDLLEITDFVRVKEPPHVTPIDRRIDRPTKPDVPPAASPPKVNLGGSKYQEITIELSAPKGPTQMYGTEPDGNYLPIVKVQPNYPRRAIQRGLMGWVILEFTVDEYGRVVDPQVQDNCVMLQSSSTDTCWGKPGSVFDRSAIEAVQRFKYKPKVVDGTPVETKGVLHKISYTLGTG